MIKLSSHATLLYIWCFSLLNFSSHVDYALGIGESRLNPQDGIKSNMHYDRALINSTQNGKTNETDSTEGPMCGDNLRVGDPCEDGNFCNGQSFCDESLRCMPSNINPCPCDTICDDEYSECLRYSSTCAPIDMYSYAVWNSTTCQCNYEPKSMQCFLSDWVKVVTYQVLYALP